MNSTTQGVEKVRRARYMREDYSKRKLRVNCTLTLAENECLKAWAEETGQSRAEALKEAGFAFIRQKAKTAVSPETTAELVALLRNITTELAEIARCSTRTQRVAFVDLYKAERRVLKLEDKFMKFLNQ